MRVSSKVFVFLNIQPGEILSCQTLGRKNSVLAHLAKFTWPITVDNKKLAIKSVLFLMVVMLGMAKADAGIDVFFQQT